MKIKSIVIAFIIFAVLGSVPLFTSKDVKKITQRPAINPVQIIQVEEMRSIPKPVEVNLLYRF
jgi:hypothetical protein